MAVYVDPLRYTRPSPKWPYGQSCHMYADSMAELRAFAVKIGLKLSWEHNIHFDLTPNKRRAALRAGAVEVTDGDGTYRRVYAACWKEKRG